MNGNRLHRRRVLQAALAGWALSLHSAGALAAEPAPPEVSAALPQARLLGQGRLRFIGLRVYEARLWTAAAALPSEWLTVPLALDIRYERSLSGVQIAERSLAEMRRQGEIAEVLAASWLVQMKRLFPDVNSGTRLTGLNLNGAGLAFHVDGKAVGEVNDAEFARRFLGIWLSPQTSEPNLRAALLGRAPG